MSDVGLSPAEVDFRDMLRNPARRREYLTWSDTVRLGWERANVVWLHGYKDGKPIWRTERPPPEPDDERAPTSSSPVRGRRYQPVRST